MNHEELCERAVRWLRGARRCNPVYSRNASCSEIPDAIGWSSAYRWKGSTVIECKTSVNDFYADKKKWIAFKHKEHGWTYRGSRNGRKQMQAEGYEEIHVPSMGDYRFFLCEPGIITAEMVTKHAPDHGLIYRDGHAMRIIKQAPKREMVDKDSEIRYLRFSIINKKVTP